MSNCTDGDMRLADSFDNLQELTREGRVEVCVNNAWGSVCRRNFGSPEAAVVCSRITGFTGQGNLFLTE